MYLFLFLKLKDFFLENCNSNTNTYCIQLSILQVIPQVLDDVYNAQIFVNSKIRTSSIAE